MDILDVKYISKPISANVQTYVFGNRRYFKLKMKLMYNSSTPIDYEHTTTKSKDFNIIIGTILVWNNQLNIEGLQNIMTYQRLHIDQERYETYYDWITQSILFNKKLVLPHDLKIRLRHEESHRDNLELNSSKNLEHFLLHDDLTYLEHYDPRFIEPESRIIQYYKARGMDINILEGDHSLEQRVIKMFNAQFKQNVNCDTQYIFLIHHSLHKLFHFIFTKEEHQKLVNSLRSQSETVLYEAFCSRYFNLHIDGFIFNLCSDVIPDHRYSQMLESWIKKNSLNYQSYQLTFLQQKINEYRTYPLKIQNNF